MSDARLDQFSGAAAAGEALNAGLQHGQRLAQSLQATGCRDKAGDWEVTDVKPWKKA